MFCLIVQHALLNYFVVLFNVVDIHSPKANYNFYLNVFVQYYLHLGLIGSCNVAGENSIIQ